MDLLLLLTGLTLLTAGWFLIWEFARFLHCSYTVPARVVSMEPGFGKQGHVPGSRATSFAFFPVIQYDWMGEPTRFTSLDERCIAALQIGDAIRLAFSRTRRYSTRVSRMVLILFLAMVMLGTGMFTAGVMLDETVGVPHMLLGSGVLAACLFILVLYMRQQDVSTPAERYRRVVAQSESPVFILEPTNVCYWKRLFTNRRQRRRIFFSKLMGAFCISVGLLLSLTAVDWASLHSPPVWVAAES